MKYLLGLATSLTLIVHGTNTLLANDLMDGLHPFLCEGHSFVLVENENGWSSRSFMYASLSLDDFKEGENFFETPDKNIEITETENGWRFENLATGGVGFLNKEGRGQSTLNWLSSSEQEQWDCIDLFPATSLVIEIVKPKIDSNIVKTQQERELLRERLAEAILALTENMALAEELRNELAQKTSDLQKANAKFKQLVVGPIGMTTLEALRDMKKSERYQAMRESKFGGAALVRSGKLGRCISSLRELAMIKEDCKFVLIDFLLDPDAK